MQECENSVPHTAMEWKKRNHLDVKNPVDGDDDVHRWYVRLESESSITSEGDTESISSIQDKETDVVRDTTDTDSTSELTFDVEFEIETTDDDDEGHPLENEMTSGSEPDFYVAEEVIAAVCADTSVEAWASDGEDSYSSSTTDVEAFGRADFWTCAQCKSKNNNPLYRLCGECFQVRKNFFPPRPKRLKKRKINQKEEAVNVDKLRSCLNGLSQDSGLGSSQELPSLDFDQIKVPQHLTTKNIESATTSGASFSSKSSVCDQEPNSSKPFVSKKRKLSQDTDEEVYNKKIVNGKSNDTVDVSDGKSTDRKRKHSNTDKDIFVKKIIIEEIEGAVRVENLQSKEVNVNNKAIEEAPLRNSLSESKELCIICNNSSKNSAFLHGNSAHTCCCYTCAMRCWKTNKRCPVCQRRVRNVIKLFIV